VLVTSCRVLDALISAGDNDKATSHRHARGDTLTTRTSLSHCLRGDAPQARTAVSGTSSMQMHHAHTSSLRGGTFFRSCMLTVQRSIFRTSTKGGGFALEMQVVPNGDEREHDPDVPDAHACNHTDNTHATRALTHTHNHCITSVHTHTPHTTISFCDHLVARKRIEYSTR
jgi:hypothetical protein